MSPSFWPDAKQLPGRHPSRARIVGIRIEQLLAADLVIGNGSLAFQRDEPVNECLAELLLHVRMPCRVDEDNAVLIEQALVAGDEDVEIAAVLERQPRAAIGEYIGVGGGGGVERRAHPLADFLVPGAFLLADVDAGSFPEIELRDMRARAVTP